MLSSQRFPRARRRRRPHARDALIGAVVALAAMLVLPAAGPTGAVLDIQRSAGSPDAPTQGQVAASQAPDLPAAAGTTADGTGATPPATGVSAAAAARPTPPSPASPAALAPSPAPEPEPVIEAAHVNDAIDRDPRLRSLGRTIAAAPATLTGYRWPLAHPRLTLPFGPTPWGTRVVAGRTYHDGVDLATFCGDPVIAAHEGVVLAAGRRFDTFMGWVGNLRPYFRRLDTLHLWQTLPIVVVIDDGNGYRSMYAHFGKVVVRPRQHVRVGQLLGYEGRTGRASGCHVHYGLFSPFETRTFGIDRGVARRMKLPTAEIARIDPLAVLPARAGINPPKGKAAPSPGASTPPATSGGTP